jgi:hypothetical protein
MEIKISEKQILIVLQIISWILFIGVSIDAGGFLSNTIYCIGFNSNLASHFWNKLDLSNLYQYDSGYFLVLTSLMCIVALMKVILFYLIVKILLYKKFDFSQPFNPILRRFISNIAYLAFGIGLFSAWGAKHSKWFISKGITLPNLESLQLSGADVWLFMSVILVVINQIIKKGIEIQTENELTI